MDVLGDHGAGLIGDPEPPSAEPGQQLAFGHPSALGAEFGGDVDSTAARNAIHVVATGDTVDLCGLNNTTYANRVLTCDPGIGVARHADAGYPEALATAEEHGIRLPMRERVH